MAGFAREIGLLGVVVRHLERTVDKLHPDYIAHARAQGWTLPTEAPVARTSIRKSGHKAFVELCEALSDRRPDIRRGSTLPAVQEEMFGHVGELFGRDPESIGQGEVEHLMERLAAWFIAAAVPRRFFIPCAITPWEAPRFSIGPVTFEYVNRVVGSDYYPGSSPEGQLDRRGFDQLLQLANENKVRWIARVGIQGCDAERGSEVADLTVDLAIVALQLGALGFDTRRMSRLDSRRGSAERRTLSEAGGHYAAGWHRAEAGTAIGPGTLSDILSRIAPLSTGVGEVVDGFASGNFRLPNLERAWCDAAYWFHQALAETIDTIAIAKLETALEVLLCAESSRGSTARVLLVLESLFGLKPDDPITPTSQTSTRQFATNLVRNRSRILHGTWSTLNSWMSHDRQGMEGFVASVLRGVVARFGKYYERPENADDIGAFLKWLSSEKAALQPDHHV